MTCARVVEEVFARCFMMIKGAFEPLDGALSGFESGRGSSALHVLVLDVEIEENCRQALVALVEISAVVAESLY